MAQAPFVRNSLLINPALTVFVPNSPASRLHAIPDRFLEIFDEIRRSGVRAIPRQAVAILGPGVMAILTIIILLNNADCRCQAE